MGLLEQVESFSTQVQFMLAKQREMLEAEEEIFKERKRLALEAMHTRQREYVEENKEAIAACLLLLL
jgi:regulator of replication initiation timing